MIPENVWILQVKAQYVAEDITWSRNLPLHARHVKSPLMLNNVSCQISLDAHVLASELCFLAYFSKDNVNQNFTYRNYGKPNEGTYLMKYFIMKLIVTIL